MEFEAEMMHIGWSDFHCVGRRGPREPIGELSNFEVHRTLKVTVQVEGVMRN